ncbi:MAG: peptidoglycan-binding protein LysM [Saprospiraceae bacterium]|nr:peptidoglycan-binding protein LysM [Saprospiraceae bacterium]MBK8633433.1 peptidoglycan-binding protein LysM [Saprospiraceae bacterium]MBP7644322.1 peptidoglycan-binding protein LysM [Saprospiraceae bacterium]HMS69947.1 peptidoglycan-binding protein LysM [Saprospiraceae bacterium]
MGLFSFLKSAGQKLLGKTAEKNDEVVEVTPEEAAAAKVAKANLLKTVVEGSGIVIDGLSVDYDGDTVTVYGQAATVADKEKVVLMLGNIDGVASVDDRMSVAVQEPESDFYEVKSGDSLSKIAKVYYGDAMKYPTIFEANKPMLSDPDKIYPGQMLRIPKL